jgi:hypothetical protein
MMRVISVLTNEGRLGCSVRISQGAAGPGICPFDITLPLLNLLATSTKLNINVWCQLILDERCLSLYLHWLIHLGPVPVRHRHHRSPAGSQLSSILLIHEAETVQ